MYSTSTSGAAAAGLGVVARGAYGEGDCNKPAISIAREFENILFARTQTHTYIYTRACIILYIPMNTVIVMTKIVLLYVYSILYIYIVSAALALGTYI